MRSWRVVRCSTISLPWSRMANALACLALLNMPFWISQRFFFVQQPVFNLDIALALALFTLHPGVGAVALAFVCLLNVAQVASLSYHFGNAVDLLSTWKFASLLNWSQFVTPSLIVALLLLAALLWAIVALIRAVRPSVSSVMSITVAFLLLDALNGTMKIGALGADQFRLNVNVAGSPVWNAVNTKLRLMRAVDAPLAAAPDAHAYQALSAWRHAHPGGSVLVILLESRGWFEEPEIRELLDQAVATPSLRQRWNVEISKEPFSGSTTYGELRTLCGLRGHYGRLTAAQGAGCLPSTLAKDGYMTLGIHGFSERMFERGNWWGTVGLARRMFANDFDTGVSICEGAFTGVCDIDVIHRALDEAQGERRFVYALTLDSHLPLNDQQVPRHLSQLCKKRRVADGSCALLAAHIQLLSVIAQGLVARQGQPMVVVAGDHSPPFNSTRERSAFSANTVPVYILRPIDQTDGHRP
jgi:phosphoglycerol transferase MdoB-like AlkP superfamily enzyme